MACWMDEKPLDDLYDTVSAPLCGRRAVLDFIRTPLAVRCNIVKVWRPLPQDLWGALTQSRDIQQSRERERRAVAAVAVIVAMLVFGLSSIGYRLDTAAQGTTLSLTGLSFASDSSSRLSAGWCYMPGISLAPVLWVALPPLAGWGFVRLLWIPGVAAGKSSVHGTLAMARHLSGTYLYVYLMVLVGVALMALLVWFAPARTQSLRWYLWCFLFGETFFVPAAMWLRLIVNDFSGQIFGRLRYSLLAAYGVAFVIIPIVGMVIVFL
jgi:hypothetical protein